MKLLISLVSIATVTSAFAAEELRWSDPINPLQQTLVSFGSYSHWLQPWRGYLETVPAVQFVNGVGIVLNSVSPRDPQQILRMCAKNGIRQVRIEIGWGSFNFDDETRNNIDGDLGARLRAAKANKMRPLILLNSHHGLPCPFRSFSRTVTADSTAGAREITLDNTSGIVPGHSGFNNVKEYIAAEYLVTGVKGNKVTLSKPWPAALKAGTVLPMATLKYAPFGDPITPEGKATLEGWKRYVHNVAVYAEKTLGTQGAPDVGFDLEIWNEMSFGANFTDMRRYYDPLPSKYEVEKVCDDVVKATAEVVNATPQLFAGARLIDGFSNTLPWPASAKMPPRVTGLSMHPYPSRKLFPGAVIPGTALNALGKPDSSGFVPTYEADFPEYLASALQTEHAIRNASPFTTDIYGVKHGRYARSGSPCWGWITEVNYMPHENGVMDNNAALQIKAKAITRLYCFYLQKGMERVYIYATGANDVKFNNLEYGMLKQEFIEHTMKDKQYPSDDSPWESPALVAVRRIVANMSIGMDAGLTKTRPIRLMAVEDTHGAKQFEGEPGNMKAHPPLYDRDIFTLLPFQANARRFVIPYYVMTRNIKSNLPPELFAVTLKGISARGAKISAYDPMTDKTQPVRVINVEGDVVKLELSATDYPTLLNIEEAL